MYPSTTPDRTDRTTHQRGRVVAALLVVCAFGILVRLVQLGGLLSEQLARAPDLGFHLLKAPHELPDLILPDADLEIRLLSLAYGAYGIREEHDRFGDRP